MADRRSFLHGLASLPLAGTSLALLCATAAAAPADLDAELITLGREWQAAADHLDRACDALDAAGERLRDIDPPEALFLQLPRDGIAFHTLAWRYGETTRRWYPEDSVEKLRVDPFVSPWGDPLVGDQARRDEIVTSHDAWRAEIAADQQATGYTAAFEVYEAAIDIRHQLRQRIIAMRATTLAGVMVKARVIEHGYGSLAEMWAELKNSLGEGQSDVDTMAVSIVADLLAIQARAAA